MTEVSGTSRFNFDARRWTGREQIVCAASLVLLISLFLPWFEARFVSFGGEAGPQLGQLSGLASHVLWIALVLIAGILVLLVLRAGLGRVPFASPPGDWQLLAGAAWLNLLLVLLAFLIKPVAGGLMALRGVSVGWQAGAYIGLAAAIVAAVAAALPLLPAVRKLSVRRPPRQPTEG
jgi:hypothetical protein